MSGLQIISSCNIYSFMTHKNTSFNDSIELMYMSMVREDVPLIVLLRELNHDNANIMCKATCGSAGYWSQVILVGGSKNIRILTG